MVLARGSTGEKQRKQRQRASSGVLTYAFFFFSAARYAPTSQEKGTPSDPARAALGAVKLTRDCFAGRRVDWCHR